MKTLMKDHFRLHNNIFFTNFLSLFLQINSISSHAATNDEDDLEDLPVEGTLPQVDDETAFRYYEYLVLGGESEEGIYV